MALLLDHQIDSYAAAGLPALAGLREGAFRALFEPLRTTAAGLPQAADATAGSLPYLAVVSDELIDPAARVPGLRLPGSSKAGILDRNHGDDGLTPYRSRDEMPVPDAGVYLLIDIDRGDEWRDVPPRDARPAIESRGRTALTIAEGLSLLTAHPGVLRTNHCFMLAGSTRGDKRVPALWISNRAPKLGWCFEGVPHSWLGVASARERIGPTIV